MRIAITKIFALPLMAAALLLAAPALAQDDADLFGGVAFSSDVPRGRQSAYRAKKSGRKLRAHEQTEQSGG